jgi:hypothetical protein
MAFSGPFRIMMMQNNAGDQFRNCRWLFLEPLYYIHVDSKNLE